MSDSIRKRFIFTFGANLSRSLLSFVTGMLVARWLGPDDYGSMAFLLGTFIGVRQFLDLGSSSAFFTFLSQRKRSKLFVWSFFLWLAAQFVITLFVIGILFPSQWLETIWHGEQKGLVLLAFSAAFLQNSVWPVVQQAGESQRRTVWVQSVSIVIVVMHFFAVLLLWWFGVLGLAAIFIAIILEYFLAAIVVHKGFEYASFTNENPEDVISKSTLRKYFTYCLPLIPYSIVGFAYEFADRWLLQNFGGSVQQAYYAVGAQFSSIALIATTSVLRIFWKEIAEAHHNGDSVRVGMLYNKVTRLLFLVGAMIAGYLIPWAEELLYLVLGSAYVGGAVTLVIMFLYPVHQSMGQIGNTMLYASEKISLQVVIGIVFMAVSICVTYFILASKENAIPGLGLGSEGLAIKMVFMQFIQVNVLAYIISRIWHLKFEWAFQFASLLGCIGLGYMASIAARGLTGSDWSLYADMVVGGVFYFIFMIMFIYLFPSLTGMKRDELVLDVNRFLYKAKCLVKV